MKVISLISICLSFIISTSCTQNNISQSPDKPPQDLSEVFKAYWFDGTAELTSFDLEQVRYGELRPGRAVTIFVTEDFSKSKFVKLDEPNQHPQDKEKVLKFNLNKQFVTGIYDYALMQSVFTPLDQVNHPHTLRVSTSNIEWCGQFLTRTELRDNNTYDIRYNSYFEGEEDLRLSLPAVQLEDEIWNQIRLDPKALPQGKLEIIPGILTQELTHQPLKVELAMAQLRELKEGIQEFTLDYQSIERRLLIRFEKQFPFKIIYWEETFRTVAGWGMESRLMTTKATKIKDTKLDYWERKYRKDEGLRKKNLGID